MSWDLRHEIDPAEVDDYAVVRVETLPPGVPAYPFTDQANAQRWLDNVRGGWQNHLVGDLTPWPHSIGEQWAIVAKKDLAGVAPAPDPTRYPSKCPSCGKAAYLGGGMRVLHSPDDSEECS